MSNKSSKSSRRWLREHFNDPYVKQAHQEGLRSRAVFKLQEIQDRDKLFKPGMTVIDLGAAPGGWSEFVASCVGKVGRVIAMDILPMDAIPGVEFLQGDFSEESQLQLLFNLIGNSKVDWVLSDIAPNMSGINSVDQPRSMYLAELALEFALQVLPDTTGGFLVKIFQGEGSESYIRELRKHFKKVAIRKPKASRGRSSEVYILARK